MALLQYRHKSAGDTLRRAQAGALLALCRRYRTPFIVNDHIELCLELGADGVHLGGTDASVAKRARVGPDRIVGASCYGERALARARPGKAPATSPTAAFILRASSSTR